MGRILLSFWAVASLSLFSSLSVFADDPSPDCMDGSKKLQIDDHKVLGWMKTTKNKFVGRALVEGRIVEVLPDQTGHDHFLIELGDKPKKKDILQVVYNAEFGHLPNLAVGQLVEACGDYITTKNDPKLKAQAIIHWVHASDNPKKHHSGYLKIDGLVYGMDIPADNHH